ncbi:MAG: YlxR family protein [Acidimicrobiales bacterium]
MGCHRVAPPGELTRLVHTGEGLVGLGSGLEGRGAWLCRDSPHCFELAVRNHAFSKALRRPIAAQALERLRAELSPGSESPRLPS